MKYTGWIGTQLLAWCGLPMVIDVISKGTAEGYSPVFLAMWGIGEILCLIYTMTRYKDWPLAINYLTNLAFIAIVIVYKI